MSTQKPKNFDALMNKYTEYIKNEHSLNILKDDYNNLSNVFDYEIDCAIKFLCELDFIRNDILSNNVVDYNELKKDALTYKGVIASEINECNELLMTMIINKKMFDDLEPIEILPILALFIEDKKNDDNVFNKDNLPYKSVEIIENIKIMKRELESLLDKYNLYYNTELNLEFPEIAYKWGSGEKLQFIVNTYGIYEGNFIRNMQKINNICVEIINICEISNNHQLIPKMQEIENLIIKDVVTFISLYIK